MSIERLTLSVVICAYTQERWGDLLRAIASVQNQSHPADEVILIIDHNPRLFERAREAFWGITVIENQEEPGLSGARNSGLAYAHGQIIAFMDEDAVASSNWIENLLRGYNSENIVGVGGTVRPFWSAKSPGWLPEEFYWVVGCSYKGLPEGEKPIRNPIGCNMSFRKHSLQAAGGFRNGMGRIGKIPIGCEETELSIRLRHKDPGAVILYQPRAIVYHNVPAWRSNWGYFANRCYAEGLSKARVTKIAGLNDSLSTERNYTTVTLPRGIINGLKEAITLKKMTGLRRAFAITAGLIMTTAGFVVGMMRRSPSKDRYILEKSKVIPEASRQMFL